MYIYQAFGKVGYNLIFPRNCVKHPTTANASSSFAAVSFRRNEQDEIRRLLLTQLELKQLFIYGLTEREHKHDSHRGGNFANCWQNIRFYKL